MERAYLAASLAMEVSPKSIADVGCGDQKLPIALRKAGWSGRYRGFDLHPQDPEISALDAAHELLPESYDAIIALGLIEYIPILDFFGRCRLRCSHLIVSHVTSSQPQNRYSRSDLERLGWLNHVAAETIEVNLRLAGFRISRSVETSEKKTLIWLAS